MHKIYAISLLLISIWECDRRLEFLIIITAILHGPQEINEPI